MPRSIPPPRKHRSPSPAKRGRIRTWSLGRRPRWLGPRLLAFAVLACLASSLTLSRAAADQPPAPDANVVSGLAPTPIPAQITILPQLTDPAQITIVPQITDLGSISENLKPWSLQPLQAAPTPAIALGGCASPNNIFQGCPLTTQSGSIRPDAERRLEDRAVASVLQQYQLPDSARPLVLKYARNEVRAALFADIEEAFQTIPPERSPDQQLLVDVFTRLVREKHVQATRAALNQYRSWRDNPCGYQPPPGFSYNPPAGACIGASRAFTPESPGLMAFAAYGLAKAYTGTAEAAAAGYVPPSVADPHASPVFWATSSAAQLGYGAAGAISAGVIGGVVGGSLPASAVSAIFPFAARTTADAAINVSGIASAGASGLASSLAILVATVSTAITAGQSVFREAAIPGDLQTLIDTANSYDAGAIIQLCGSNGCVSATSTDLRRTVDQELFANLVLTTLPDFPSTDPAPAAQPGDPQLLVAGNPVDWVQYTANDGTQRAFRMSSGPWFADRAGSNGAGVLALSIGFKDAAGAKWAARRVGNQFLIVRTDLAPTNINYPAPRQSEDLSIVDWSGNTVTARAGG